MRILKHNVVNKLPLIPHQVHGQNWPLEWREVSPSHESQSFAPATRGILSQNKILCVHASGFISCPPNTQQRDQPLSSSVTKEKPCLLPCWLPCWDSELEAGKRWIFLFDLLPNYSSVGTMGVKTSLKILTRYILFGEDTSRCKCVKANASCPCKGTFVE